MKKKKTNKPRPVLLHGAFKTQGEAQTAMGKAITTYPSRKFSIKPTRNGRFSVMSRI